MKLLTCACAIALSAQFTTARAVQDPPPLEKPANPLQASAEVGYGYEHYSAPLVRFNDQGPVIHLIGRQHASGNFLHVSGWVMRDFSLTDSISFQVSGATWNRRFESTPDLDIGLMSVDGIFRYQWGESSIGFGPSLQTIASGGQHFRNRQSIQLDWTHPEENKGYTSVVLEMGRNQHSNTFRDLDGHSTLLLVRKQITAPLGGIDEVSIEAGIVRELNRHGYDDLSNRQIYGRFGFGFEALGLEWSISATLQKARFDGPLLDALPARRDTFRYGDISASYALSKDISLRASMSAYRNHANIVLYDGQFHGNSISLSATF